MGGLSFNEVVRLIPVILWRSQTECHYIIICSCRKSLVDIFVRMCTYEHNLLAVQVHVHVAAYSPCIDVCFLGMCVET